MDIFSLKFLFHGDPVCSFSSVFQENHQNSGGHTTIKFLNFISLVKCLNNFYILFDLIYGRDYLLGEIVL